MQLVALRPAQGADLQELHSLIDSRGWRAALPEALPEPVLIGLAHDLRMVECGLAGELKEEEDEASSLATALYVLLNLLRQHPDEECDSDDLCMSEAGLMHALQIYQWGIEREITSRILGRCSATQSSSLLESLWRSARE